MATAYSCCYLPARRPARALPNGPQAPGTRSDSPPPLPPGARSQRGRFPRRRRSPRPRLPHGGRASRALGRPVRLGAAALGRTFASCAMHYTQHRNVTALDREQRKVLSECVTRSTEMSLFFDCFSCPHLFVVLRAFATCAMRSAQHKICAACPPGPTAAAPGEEALARPRRLTTFASCAMCRAQHKISGHPGWLSGRPLLGAGTPVGRRHASLSLYTYTVDGPPDRGRPPARRRPAGREISIPTLDMEAATCTAEHSGMVRATGRCGRRRRRRRRRLTRKSARKETRRRERSRTSKAHARSCTRVSSHTRSPLKTVLIGHGADAGPGGTRRPVASDSD